MNTIAIEKDLADLFADLHHAGIFKDGKTISDAIFRYPPDEIMARYQSEKKRPDFDLRAFFEASTYPPPVRESDYQSDPDLPVMAHIEKLWDVLTRRPDATTRGFSTLIPLPYPYVVPGGRFNEIYYWDSYFTMLGLQVSGRVDLIEHMTNNFAWLIDRFGFIPNGNRTYFLSRSQPPFFALMVDLLAEEKGPEVFLKYLPALQKEYAFWMAGTEKTEAQAGSAFRRVVRVEGGGHLNRYFDDRPEPRTEMYLDDLELLAGKDPEAARHTLTHLKAACESGWDFSSRWCLDPLRLDTIHTADLLPVDLNCLMYFLEKTLAKAFHIAENEAESHRFDELADARSHQISALFWNAETGFFHDFDFIQNARTPALTLAGVFPLFFNLASPEQARSCARAIAEKLLRPGGLVTTPVRSGQQWDAPNGWAPLQWIAIRGLRNYALHQLADEIKNRWTALNIKVYKNTGKLMEKYNVEDLGLESGGGEYPVQDGFGWTNGVLAKLLAENGAPKP
ncbi:MAG: alpha,alpha-trehalase TreF [Bacteroidetes bacterium]|nr:MAG: alpha,alpha-trehalase TreF [Bacteroidota bacterium]